MPSGGPGFIEVAVKEVVLVVPAVPEGDGVGVVAAAKIVVPKNKKASKNRVGRRVLTIFTEVFL